MNELARIIRDGIIDDNNTRQDIARDLPRILATPPARTVPPAAIIPGMDCRPGDVLGGALYWTRAVRAGENETILAETASGHAVFAEDIDDAWVVVAANGGPNYGAAWSLTVKVVGVRL